MPEPASQRPRVAVIGLGSMGFGMATSLRRAGFEVTGCDVAAESVALLRGFFEERRAKRAVAAEQVEKQLREQAETNAALSQRIGRKESVIAAMRRN